MIRLLSDLEPGQNGIIQSLDISPEVSAKFMEMGMVPGERVHVCRRAPLGGPIEVELMQYRLAIRRAEAQHITVDVP